MNPRHVLNPWWPKGLIANVAETNKETGAYVMRKQFCDLLKVESRFE